MICEHFIVWLDKYEKLYPSSIIKQAFEDLIQNMIENMIETVSRNKEYKTKLEIWIEDMYEHIGLS